jgi:hypothetical protein
MYKLQMKKFKAHPELIKEITDRGGVAFLSASEHTVGVKGSRWEGKGTNSNFIKVLIKSYQDSLKNTQAPQTSSFEIVQTEAIDQPGGKFAGLIKNQAGVPTVVDTLTGTVIKPAMIFDESKFVSGDAYTLDAQTVQEIGAANPGKLFAFDDFFLTTTNVSMDGVDKSKTRQAWISGKGMGISLGIPTLAAPVSTAIPVTDQNYDALKTQIDAALDRLLEKKRQGIEIVFPSRGLGQTFVGFDIQPRENVRTNDRPAPSLFVHLSKRLLQDFAYQNPTLSALTAATPGVTTTLGTQTGSEFVQGYYKGIGAQSVTDTYIKEFIKKCKGLS